MQFLTLKSIVRSWENASEEADGHVDCLSFGQVIEALSVLEAANVLGAVDIEADGLPQNFDGGTALKIVLARALIELRRMIDDEEI